MAYNKVVWTDHVVTRPRTYAEIVNEDGSFTHAPAMGEVLQSGTPMSADNYNNIEDALQHTSVALDWLFCITQAQMRDMQARIDALGAQ